MPELLETNPDAYLRRYTHLPAVLSMLQDRALTLLDPSSWDDSNDSFYIAEYKRRRSLKTALALCFTGAEETHHHWRVFAGHASGVCIRFHQDPLISAIHDIKGTTVGKVQYLTTTQARTHLLTTAEYPFVKRAAFTDEHEVRAFFQSKTKSIPLLQVSEVFDSTLMWAHYAESHRGFVLAFDPQDEHFSERKGPNDELRHLRCVEYRSSRPSAALVQLTGVDFFLVKDASWEYEREWRIFRPLGDAEIVLPDSPHAVHLFRYPPRSVKTVILGARASAQTKSAVFAAIRGNPALTHVRVEQAVLDQSSFGMSTVEAHS